MTKVLIRKEPDGQISAVHTSDPEAYVRIFDVEQMVRGFGRETADKAYLEVRNYVLGRPFSVLLQYPGGDTYYAWVTALDAEGAAAAAKADYQVEHPDEDLPESETLLVLAGHVDAELRQGGF